MKKLFLCLVLCLFLSGIVFADGLTVAPKQGSWITLYDLEAHALKTGLRYPALGWKDLFFLEGTMITDFDTVGIGVGMSVELIALGRFLGLNVYLTDNVNIGFSGAYNFRDKKPVWGPYAGVVIKL